MLQRTKKCIKCVYKHLSCCLAGEGHTGLHKSIINTHEKVIHHFVDDIYHAA